MFWLKLFFVLDDYIVTNWGNDEYFFGAYSYARIGMIVFDVEVLVVLEYDGWFYFVGEVCLIIGL